MAGKPIISQYMKLITKSTKTNAVHHRIVEEEIESAIDSRTESLQLLRELGPPDLVHLVKQSVKSGGRQVHEAHHFGRSQSLICPSDRSLPPCYWR